MYINVLSDSDNYKLWTMFCFIVVISEPDDTTTCEGEQTKFTCRLGGLKKEDVQWYRFLKDTNTTEMVDPNGNFTTRTVRQTIRSSITIILDTTGLEHHILMLVMYLSL